MDENTNVADQTADTSTQSVDDPVQEQTALEAPAEQTQQDSQQASESQEDNQPETNQETRREKRQSRFIEKLSKQLEQSRGQSFKEKLNNPEGYKPIEYGEQEYPIEQLNADRQKYGEAQYQQGLDTAQQVAQTTVWKDSVERDNDFIDEKFPIMDENSDEYDSDIANYINNLYLKSTGYDGTSVKNPIRYRDFVQANMELADRLKVQASAETAQNVSRQASQASIKSGANSRRSARDWSQPGAIANLSPDEYDKFKPEIDAWMTQNVNPNIRR